VPGQQSPNEADNPPGKWYFHSSVWSSSSNISYCPHKKNVFEAFAGHRDRFQHPDVPKVRAEGGPGWFRGRVPHKQSRISPNGGQLRIGAWLLPSWKGDESKRERPAPFGRERTGPLCRLWSPAKALQRKPRDRTRGSRQERASAPAHRLSASLGVSWSQPRQLARGRKRKNSTASSGLFTHNAASHAVTLGPPRLPHQD